ncbi:hypothetical protein AbraIFM66951_000303 [Aspergillus brasiliensis]|uniref:DUF3533 domain-containing protein n=1 Tax=Aspergillus brasiliensis TaxID=319629 RepID=A0A9W5YGI8_9EURO|nr:hypothetical protein AbraCBS73388_000044 [Aspergillus brasiliensis]GKZ40534.1 hypothetical protein AbraIFM66951_000303 [Aspergillus brasiliensis]
MAPPSHSPPSHWKAIQKPFLLAVTGSFVLLQLLFLGNFCYLYGTQFQSTDRAHNFNILLVDYDGGVVGRSLNAAYQALKGDSFPTLDQRATTDYPTTKDIQEAVCRGSYWAAIYSNADASTRLSSALNDETAAADYQSTDALSYVWNEARYPAESDAELLSNLQMLVSYARSAYYKINGTAVAQFATLTNPAILQVFADPIEAMANNIQPTVQGTRVLYNTVTMVLPIIQQFFFLMALNGVSSQFQLYTQLGYFFNGMIRAGLSAAYTLLGSLCTAGYIWAYRENWGVNGNQFALTWMVFWLYMQINFLILDTATAYIPMQFMPFFVLTWAITNVASSITPFEMSPGFYRWGYALPAHEVYSLLAEVWSGGCARQSYRALPILFAWWIVGMVAVVYATRYRCTTAVRAQAMASAATTGQRVSVLPSGEVQESQDEVSHPAPSDLPSASGRGRAQSQSLSQTQAYELYELERNAYSPSYPTPLVRRQSQAYSRLGN